MRKVDSMLHETFKILPILIQVGWLIVESFGVSLQNLFSIKKDFVIYLFFFKWCFTILGRTARYFCVLVSCSSVLLQSLNKNCYHRTDVLVPLSGLCIEFMCTWRVADFKITRKEIRVSSLLSIFPQSHFQVNQPVFGEVFTKTSDAGLACSVEALSY